MTLQRLEIYWLLHEVRAGSTLAVASLIAESSPVRFVVKVMLETRSACKMSANHTGISNSHRGNAISHALDEQAGIESVYSLCVQPVTMFAHDQYFGNQFAKQLSDLISPSCQRRKQSTTHIIDVACGSHITWINFWIADP